MTELRNLKLDLIKLAARPRGGDWRETDDRGGLLPEGSRRVHAAVETLLEALEKAPPLWDELLWELGYEFPPEPFFALPTCHEYHGEDCGCDVGLTARDKDWWVKAGAKFPRFEPEFAGDEWHTSDINH